MQCGPARYQVGKGAAGEEALLARVMAPRFTKTRLDDVDQENFTQLADKLCADEARNGLIVRDVAHVLDGGGTALILTRRVEHAARLEKALAAQGYETMLLVGSDLQRIKREKLRMLGQFASGKPFAIVATGSYVGEGFDDDRLEALFVYAQTQTLQLVNELVAINKIEGWGAVPRCFSFCFRGESAGGDKKLFVRSSLHGTSEIAYFRRRHAAFVSLALKYHMKAHNTVKANNSFAVDAVIV